MTTIKNVTEEKEKRKIKFKNLIRFLNPNKINNYNSGGKMGKKIKKKRIYRTSQKIRIMFFLESLLSESFLWLGITAHLITLGCPPTLC